MKEKNYLPFEMVSIDHCGPFPTMLHGYTHYTVAICHCLDFSVMIHTDSLSTDSTCASIKSFRAFVERQTKYNIETHVEVAPSKFRDERAVRHLQKNCKLL